MTVRRTCLAALGTALLLVSQIGCEQQDDPSGGGGSVPAPGDPYEGGKVVGSTPGGPNCTIVTIEYPAEWQCTDAQLAVATGGGSGPKPGNGGVTGDVELRATTCEALADLRRSVLKEAQRAALAQRHAEVLADRCLVRQETLYVDDQGEPTSACGGGPIMDAGGVMDGSTGSDPGSGAEEYSTTNTQVADVDEADYIKNDSGYIYVLSADGLHVLDAWPAPEAHELAHVDLPGEPRRLFLRGDRLVSYSYMAGTDGSPSPGVPSSQGCTYGYDCRFASEGGRTLVQVFDVSNPAAPVALERYEMSGGYVSSRRIDDHVYTVVHDVGVTSVPGLDLSLDAATPEALETQYQERLQAADLAADTLAPAYFLPWVRKLAADGQVLADITSCSQALLAAAAEGSSFVSLIAFDLSTTNALSRSIVATKPGFVYASAQALYLATDGDDGSDYPSYADASSERTTIHKFSLQGADIFYVGSTAIRGHILNQFGMDEYQGVLRVATTSGWVPSPDVSSNISIVAQEPGRLAIVGELTGLAPQEDIRSVRFDGTRGFVVTFKKTDPLFVIDLANPAAPAVLGELKIPGFSTYMHMLDTNHLLAVGFDADDHGDFAYFDGIQLQIFDVSDLANPALLHKTVIGTRGSASEALLNHLAFNYFPPRKMLALPMTICEGGDDGSFGDTLTFSGLMVFDVSLDAGITEHGRMPFVQPSEIPAGTTCGAWWTGGTSLVKRSIFMDEFAYGASDARVNVAALGDLGNVLQSIPID